MLVGTKKDLIVKKALSLLNDDAKLRKFLNIENPYGDGNASKRIVNFILEQDRISK